MKKLLLGLLFSSAILFGNESTQGFSLGVVSMNTENDSGIGGDISYKYSNYYNTVYWGGKFSFEFGSVKDIEIYNYSVDIRLGVIPVKNVSIYGIGSVMRQSLDNRESGGFGAGGGIEYRFNRKVSTSIDYISYNMSPTTVSTLKDYNFDKVIGSLNFNF